MYGPADNNRAMSKSELDPNRWQHFDCADLALELHRRTGWPLFVVADEQNEYGVAWLHAVVQRPDKTVLDSLGVHDPEELLDDWLEWASGNDEEGVWLHPADEEMLKAKAADEGTHRMADSLLRKFWKVDHALSSERSTPGVYLS